MILSPFQYCNTSLLEDGFFKSHMPRSVFMQRKQSSRILLSFINVADSEDVSTSHLHSNICRSEIIFLLTSFVNIFLFSEGSAETLLTGIYIAYHLAPVTSESVLRVM